MLVLSRTTDEQIVIGKNIIITIVGIRGEKVRIGIDAPKEISVLRQELITPEALEALRRASREVGTSGQTLDIQELPKTERRETGHGSSRNSKSD